MLSESAPPFSCTPSIYRIQSICCCFSLGAFERPAFRDISSQRTPCWSSTLQRFPPRIRLCPRQRERRHALHWTNRMLPPSSILSSRCYQRNRAGLSCWATAFAHPKWPASCTSSTRPSIFSNNNTQHLIWTRSDGKGQRRWTSPPVCNITSHPFDDYKYISFLSKSVIHRMIGNEIKRLNRLHGCSHRP